MQARTKVFLGEELYEGVWTTPMRKLLRELKYSDVGLASSIASARYRPPESATGGRSNWDASRRSSRCLRLRDGVFTTNPNPESF